MKTLAETLYGLDNKIIATPSRNTSSENQVCSLIMQYDGGDLLSISQYQKIDDKYVISIELATTPFKGKWYEVLNYYGHSNLVRKLDLAISMGVEVEIVLTRCEYVE